MLDTIDFSVERLVASRVVLNKDANVIFVSSVPLVVFAGQGPIKVWVGLRQGCLLGP